MFWNIIKLCSEEEWIPSLRPFDLNKLPPQQNKSEFKRKKWLCMYLGWGGTIMKAIFAVEEESQQNSFNSGHWSGLKFFFNLKIGFKYNCSRMHLLGRTKYTDVHSHRPGQASFSKSKQSWSLHPVSWFFLLFLFLKLLLFKLLYVN